MKGWADTGEAYAASYASLCAGTHDAIVDLLGAGTDRTLLDVGSGTGALIARLHAHGWDAFGCEPEPSMRAVAAREHPHQQVRAAGLPDLPFGDAGFAAVTANFVLNHVPDPRRAAAEMARVVAVRGRLIATTWVVSPSWFWLAVCDRAGLEPATGERLAPEKDFARTTAGFGAMLAEGGWSGVRVREVSWTWRVAPAALWASAEGGVASAGLFYRALDADARHAFRTGFDAVCAEHAEAGTIALDHVAAIAVGERTA